MRAQELKSMIHEGPCFVLDLHTTTSNMGNTVIISHAQPFNFQVAAELVKNLPDTRVILSPDPNKKFLASQSEFGMMIEVGPVAHGVIDANILEKTLALITELLKAVSTPTGMTTGEIEIYEEIQDVYYPQNENGELTAIINKDFQGKDFVPVEGSFTPFKAFAGEEQEIRSSEKLYPIFINEAAYYPMKLAFTLCRKRALNY
jgi:aspartoacylase